MAEMRDIVAYLVEHNAYGEVRARNMWQQLERSKLTDRTWQSLKETFLKRILPEIHNPYYKLTPEQIASFRSGKSVNRTKLNTNKLESKPPSEASDTGGNPGTGELSDVLVEGRRSERSSVETVVLDTAESLPDGEDIISNLKANKVTPASPKKSLKDLIVYTEPLTPMMQEITADWETDSSSRSNSALHRKENSGEAASTADTFLPNNQEAIKPTDSQSSAISNTQASEPLKTRSQANTQSSKVVKTRSQSNYSMIKSDLNNKSKKEINGLEPTEKKARLSDETNKIITSISSKITENKDLGKGQQDSLALDGNVPRTRSKKNISKEKMGDFSSTADLLSVLSDTTLPNNQEQMRVNRKDLQPSDTSKNVLSILSAKMLPNNQEGMLALQKFLVPQTSDASTNEGTKLDTHSTEISPEAKKKDKKNADSKTSSTKTINSSDFEQTEDKSETQVSDSRTEMSAQTFNKKVNDLTESQSQTDNRNQKKTSRTASKATIPKENVTNKDAKLSVSDEGNNNYKPSRTPSPTVDRKKKKMTEISIIGTELKAPDKLIKEKTVISPKPGSSKELEQVIEKTPELNYSLVVNAASEVETNTFTADSSVNLQSEKEVETIGPVDSDEDKGTENNEFRESNPCLQSVSLYKETENVETEKASQAELENEKDTLKPNESDEAKQVTATEINRMEITEITDDDDVEGGTKKPAKLRRKPVKVKNSGVILLPSHSSESDESSSIRPTARRGKSRRGRVNTVALPKFFGFVDGHTRSRRCRKRVHEHVESASSSDSNWSEDSFLEEAIPVPRPGRRHLQMGRPAVGRVQTLSDGSLVALCGRRVYTLVSQRGGKVYEHRYALSRDGAKESTDDESLLRPRTHRAPPATILLDTETESRSSKDACGSSKDASGSSKDACGSSKDACGSSKDARLPEVVVSATAAAGPAGGGAPPPHEQTCIVLTKDKITLSGNVECFMSVLPHFQQLMRGLEPAEPSTGSAAEQAVGATAAGVGVTAAGVGVTAAGLAAAAEGARVNAAGAGVTAAGEGQTTEGATNASRQGSVARQSNSITVDDNVIRARVDAIEEEIFRTIAEQDDAARSEQMPAEQTPAETSEKSPAQAKTAKPPASHTSPRENVKRSERKALQLLRSPRPARRALRSPRVSDGAGAAQAAEEGAVARGEAEAVARGSDSEREIIIQEEAAPRRRRAVPTRDTKSVYARGSADSSEHEARYALPASAAAIRPAKTKAKRRHIDKENKNVPQHVPCESTQGYQDSDSSFNLSFNRRRRFSHQLDRIPHRSSSLQRCHDRRSYQPRRRSSVLLMKNFVPPSSDSESPSNSKQLQEKQTQTSPDKIGDRSGLTDCEDSERLTPQPDHILSRDTSIPGLDEDLPRCNTNDVANSSNVTLPPSPELSIVEQISVRARSISQYNARTNTINEQIEMNESDYNTRRVSVVLDPLDFTCPLMEQEFTVACVDTQRHRDYNPKSAEDMEVFAATVEDMIVSGNSTETRNMKEKHHETVTDSLISRVTEVNINDTPTLEAIEIGLVDLRVLSAGGKSIGTSEDVPNFKRTLKSGKTAMKRCSTPNKRKKVRKSQPPAVPSVEEEELIQHTEYCVQKRRKSCPALFHLEQTHSTEPDTVKILSQTKKCSPVEIPQVIITPAGPIDTVTKRKPRKPNPKVIKVKILRPKKSAKLTEDNKVTGKSKNKRSSMGVTEMYSSVNYSVEEQRLTKSSLEASMSDGSSVNLKHNHSDSCLVGQQCLAEASASGTDGTDRHELTPSPDCFSSEARDATRFSEESSPGSTVLRLSELGSLLTEDATGSSGAACEREGAGEGWGEESWSARDDAEEEAELRARYGAHIANLYPLVSAVPHLSTITEASCDTRSRDTRSRDALTFDRKNRDVMSSDLLAGGVQSGDSHAQQRSRRECQELLPASRLISSEDAYVTCSSSPQYSVGTA